jgi:transcriptional regulator with XRE-family HTH domain
MTLDPRLPDMTGCLFTYDHAGKLLSVELTAAIFGALTTVYVEARKSQMRAIEDQALGAPLRSSLAGLRSGAPAPTQRRNGSGHGSQSARARAESLFLSPDERALQAVVEAERPPEPASPSHRSTNPNPRFFPREFLASIPPEVGAMIDRGVYFLTAWREYRRLTLADAADLCGVTQYTIRWHEYGKNVPTESTIKRFADIYDCTPEQLTARTGSNCQRDDIEGARKKKPAPCAPIGTEYPRSVLGKIMDGKTPITAWRLYRGLSIQQCAETYGTSVANFKTLKAVSFRVREKLAVVFNCRPVQLLPPADLDPAPGGPRDEGNDMEPARERSGVAALLLRP